MLGCRLQSMMVGAGGRWALASGVTALHLARCISPSCSLRQQWLETCHPAMQSEDLAGDWIKLLTHRLWLPSPLKMLLTPSEFQLYFPGASYNARDPRAKAQAWQCLKNRAGMDMISAICCEGDAPMRLCSGLSRACG